MKCLKRKGLTKKVQYMLAFGFVVSILTIPSLSFAAKLAPVFGTFENQSLHATEDLSLRFTYGYYSDHDYKIEDITSIEVAIQSNGNYTLPSQNLKFRPWLFSSKQLVVKVELFSNGQIIGTFPRGDYYATDYRFPLKDKEAYKQFHEYFKYVDVSDLLRDFKVVIRTYDDMPVRQYLDKVVEGTTYQDLDQYAWTVEATGLYYIVACNQNGEEAYHAVAGRIENTDGLFSQSAAIYRAAIIASWDNDTNNNKSEIVLTPTIGGPESEYSASIRTLLVPKFYKNIKHQFRFAKIKFDIMEKNDGYILASVFRGLDPRYTDQPLSSSEPLEAIEFIFRNPEEAKKWL